MARGGARATVEAPRVAIKKVEGITMSRFVPARFARAFAVLSAIPAIAFALAGQTPLPGASVPKYVDPVPTFVGQRIGGPLVAVTFRETVQQPLPATFYAGLPAPFSTGTTVWGYQVAGLDADTNRPVSRGPNWPGFTIEAVRGRPTNVLYSNELRTPTLQALLPVDQTLNWADPLNLGCQFQPVMSAACMQQYAGPVPMVVHLHGSEVPPAFDGGPDAWFTSTGRRGPNFGSLIPTRSNQALYRYPNSQEGTTLWFHDHALGTTRLNVLGGVAAFYLLRDDQDTGKATNPLRLPAGAQEVELVIQDRAFDTNGQLLYDDPTQTTNPDVHPFWRPEFFGDVVTVNGKSWPFLSVEPRRYRLRLLNGSNARFYNLALQKSDGTAGPAIYQIGTDGGRLDEPVALASLLIAPGERADVIVDFTAVPGATLTLTNDANAPYPDGDPVDPATTAQIMQFKVGLRATSADRSCDPALNVAARGRPPGPVACTLRPGAPIVRLVDAAAGTLAAGVAPSAKRQLILKEIASDLGPLEVVVNNTKYSGFKQSTLTTTLTPVTDSVGLGSNFVTEAPQVGATEVWEVANITVDAHPIHVHLVQFQVLNRQVMDTGEDPVTGAPFGYLDAWLASFPGAFFTPGDGPPLPYLTANADGAVGGNPAFSPFLVGAPTPPAANEAGWKDTVVMLPGQVTRIAVRWAPTTVAVGASAPGVNQYPFDPTNTNPRKRDAAGNPGAAGYVWHCHILEHEDNEMMRPYAVRP